MGTSFWCESLLPISMQLHSHNACFLFCTVRQLLSTVYEQLMRTNKVFDWEERTRFLAAGSVQVV